MEGEVCSSLCPYRWLLWTPWAGICDMCFRWGGAQGYGEAPGCRALGEVRYPVSLGSAAGVWLWTSRVAVIVGTHSK